MTVGLLVLLFVGWELWFTNIAAGQAQDQATSQFLEGTEPVEIAPVAPGEALLSAEEQAEADRQAYGEPPAASAAEGTFGLLYVPRFGENYVRPIGSGVSMDLLNTVGVGHYPQTQMPGEPGNFAVAGHRQTHGQVFYDIDKLTEGDRLYVQTREGFYQYVWRETEIVSPADVDVLLPVPHQPEATPEYNLLTLTSCHPIFSTAQRIIAYAELESFRPADAGPQDLIRAAYSTTID